LFINPEVEFSNPIWATVAPKKKENCKQSAGESSQTFDHETHLLAGNMKAKHPTGQMFDMEILTTTPRQDCSRRLTVSSLRRRAERPKLATNLKEGESWEGVGLTEQPKRSEIWLPNLSLGSKEMSESPTMADFRGGGRHETGMGRGAGRWWGEEEPCRHLLFLLLDQLTTNQIST